MLHSCNKNSGSLCGRISAPSLFSSGKRTAACRNGKKKKERSKISANTFNEERWEVVSFEMKDAGAEHLLSNWCSKYSCYSQLDEVKLIGQITKQWNTLSTVAFWRPFNLFISLQPLNVFAKSTLQVYSRKIQADCHNENISNTWMKLIKKKEIGSRKTATAQRFPSVPRAVDGRHEWVCSARKKKLKTKTWEVGFFSFILNSGSFPWRILLLNIRIGASSSKMCLILCPFCCQ